MYFCLRAALNDGRPPRLNSLFIVVSLRIRPTGSRADRREQGGFRLRKHKLAYLFLQAYGKLPFGKFADLPAEIPKNLAGRGRRTLPIRL